MRTRLAELLQTSCDRIWLLLVVSYLVLPISSTSATLATNIKAHKFANGSHLITYVAQKPISSEQQQQQQSDQHNSTLKSKLSFQNHRMDSLNASVSNQHDHRLATDSILRPQLALQIFTHPIPASSNQNSDYQGQQSGKISAANDGRRGSLSGARSRSIDYHNDRSHMLGGSPSTNWRYETSTDQQQNALSSRDGFANEDQNFASSSSENQANSSPLINAIITVPAASGDHDYHENNGQSNHQRHSRHNNFRSSTTPSSDNQHSQPANSDEVVTQVSGVDQVISKILDSQASGNLEFSMNLNGDEIIINPANKNNIVFSLGNSSRDAIDGGGGGGGGDGGGGDDDDVNGDANSNTKSYTRRSRDDSNDQSIISRALRKHVASEMAGDEQSASEMDVIDGQNDDGDMESDFDGSSASKSSEDDSSRPKLKDIDAEIERDERNNPHKAWMSSTNSDLTGSSSTDDQKDEPKSMAKSRSTSKSRDNDNSEERRTGSESRRVRKSSGKLTFNRKDKDANDLSSNNLRKASSKRRLIFKTSAADRDSSESQDNRNDRLTSGKQSTTVTINGEDVRRFEQLLEEMRSLSMNNLGQAKAAKRLSKSPSKVSVKQSSGDEDQDTYGRYLDDNDSSNNNNNQGEDMQSKSQVQVRGATRRQTKSSEPPAENANDCDRRGKQRPLQRAASESDAESSQSPSSEATVSLVDKDSSAMDGDGSSDELNDEGSQNIEQQEEPSASRQRKSPAEDVKPKTVYVRKTILQNYYDNNSNQATNDVIDNNSNPGGDDLESVHKSQHEAQHERQASSDDTNLNQQQQQYQVRPSQTSPINYNGPSDLHPHRQVAETPSPLNNYIDYSNLDDRDVYRASESQKLKVSMPPRDQIDRMRSLQQVIERAAIEQSAKNGRV